MSEIGEGIGEADITERPVKKEPKKTSPGKVELLKNSAAHGKGTIESGERVFIQAHDLKIEGAPQTLEIKGTGTAYVEKSTGNLDTSGFASIHAERLERANLRVSDFAAAFVGYGSKGADITISGEDATAFLFFDPKEMGKKGLVFENGAKKNQVFDILAIPGPYDSSESAGELGCRVIEKDGRTFVVIPAFGKWINKDARETATTVFEKTTFTDNSTKLTFVDGAKNLNLSALDERLQAKTGIDFNLSNHEM